MEEGDSWFDGHCVWRILVPVFEQILDFRDQQTAGVVEFWCEMGPSAWAKRDRNVILERAWTQFQGGGIFLFLLRLVTAWK